MKTPREEILMAASVIGSLLLGGFAGLQARLPAPSIVAEDRMYWSLHFGDSNTLILRDNYKQIVVFWPPVSNKLTVVYGNKTHVLD